jgi:hypothetical protein
MAIYFEAYALGRTGYQIVSDSGTRGIWAIGYVITRNDNVMDDAVFEEHRGILRSSFLLGT